MRKHVKTYMQYFHLDKGDFIYDEYEYIVNKKTVKAVNIHHIEHGANKKEQIGNYMALSMENHNLCHTAGKDKAGDFSDREKLKEIHLQFLIDNPY